MVVPGWYKSFLFLVTVSALAWGGQLAGLWSGSAAIAMQLLAVWLALFDAAAFRQVLEEREKIRKLLRRKKKKP